MVHMNSSAIPNFNSHLQKKHKTFEASILLVHHGYVSYLHLVLLKSITDLIVDF